MVHDRYFFIEVRIISLVPRTDPCCFTCRGGVGGLEEANHTLGVETCRAQQDGLCSGIPPANYGEAVLSVAAADSLDGRVRDVLRHYQEARVAVTHTHTHTHTWSVLSTESIPSILPAPIYLLLPLLSYLLQTVYMRLTVDILKGSFFERVRLLLSVPRPRRW